MEQLDAAKGVLEELSQRVRANALEGDAKREAGFVALIDVVDDAGRALAAPHQGQLEDFLPHVAALREVLEDHYLSEGLQTTPARALADQHAGAPYAAGALWAMSAMIYGLLVERDYETHLTLSRSTRGSIRQTVVELLAKEGLVRPTDVINALEHAGRAVDKSTVSRALGDLLEAGVIEPAEPPRGASRRHRYYRATERPSQPPEHVVEVARQGIAGLRAWCGDTEFQALLERLAAEAR